MTDNRILHYCGKCKKGWLIEPKKIEWKGTEPMLRKHEQNTGRKYNHCNCGEPLYGGKQDGTRATKK